MSDKQDIILTMLYEMKPIVQDTQDRVRRMEDRVEAASVKNAEQDIHISTLKERIGKHLANHWAWVGAMMGGLGVVAALIEIWRKRP